MYCSSFSPLNKQPKKPKFLSSVCYLFPDIFLFCSSLGQYSPKDYLYSLSLIPLNSSSLQPTPFRFCSSDSTTTDLNSVTISSTFKMRSAGMPGWLGLSAGSWFWLWLWSHGWWVGAPLGALCSAKSWLRDSPFQPPLLLALECAQSLTLSKVNK